MLWIICVNVDSAEEGDKDTRGYVVENEQEEDGEEQMEEWPCATGEEPEVVPEVPPSDPHWLRGCNIHMQNHL